MPKPRVGQKAPAGGTNSDDELFQQLTKSKQGGRALWWNQLDVVMVDCADGTSVCKLKCCICRNLLTTTNPSQTAKSHCSLWSDMYACGLVAQGSERGLRVAAGQLAGAACWRWAASGGCVLALGS